MRVGIDKVADCFGIPALPDSWCAADRLLKETGVDRPFLFDPTQIENSLGWINMAPSVAELVLEAAHRINASPVLIRAAEIATYLLFNSQDRERIPAEDFPLPSELPMFYAPIFVSAIPDLREMHRDSGIPAEYTKSLLEDIERWIAEHRFRYGEWGLSETKWLRHHFWGDLFQIGRLQFQFRTFDLPFCVFRNDDSSATVTIVAGRYPIRDDGQFAEADAKSYFPPSPPFSGNTFETAFDDRSDFIIAHPVEPDGVISPAPIRLSLRNMSRVLQPDDRIIAVHIPGGDRLVSADVGDAIADARRFFIRYFPSYHARAFTCESWLLDSQLGRYLPPASNILAFQRRFTVVPVPGTHDHQHFERIFGASKKPASALPRDNRLRRAICEHIESGESWRVAGGFIIF